MTTRLLHLAEVAALLRRTESQMRWLIHTGQAPRSALIGGRRMFREEDCEAWLAEQFEREAQ